jgi:hypothetical protein
MFGDGRSKITQKNTGGFVQSWNKSIQDFDNSLIPVRHTGTGNYGT